MDWSFSSVSGLFAQEPERSLLLQGKWGLEKEALRVTSTGEMALTPHPAALGDKQTNPFVTVDFSESQLEIITQPHPSLTQTYRELTSLQKFVEKSLDNEWLWPLSMPARLPSEDRIPLARFDNSPAGREKALYREGLARRYGKKRQLISGIHYNFSFADGLFDVLHRHFGRESSRKVFRNGTYSAVARNFLKYRWLFIYLFGASPTFDSTYTSVTEQELADVRTCCPAWVPFFTNYPLYATSLRLSRFGYSHGLQQKFFVSFNSLDEYTRDIRRLINRKSDYYAQLTGEGSDLPVQLNSGILQKESEFYSPLRFKQTVAEQESLLEALEQRGTGYLEIRIPDLNPFEKTGIGLETLHFLQVFMLLCLFEQSPPLNRHELKTFNENHHLVALAGRKPRLKLHKPGNGPILLADWSTELFEKLNAIAGLLDKSQGAGYYRSIIRQEYRKILDPSLLPSARIQQEMAGRHESFLEFGVRRAAANRLL